MCGAMAALAAICALAGCSEKPDSSLSTPPLSSRPTNTASDTDLKAERDSSVAANAAADNTAKNAQDRAGGTLTPGDQGNSPADVELTQKIRSALVVDSSGYSVTAKNIKIVTVNGKVTLRGPVNTDAEKAGIVILAKGIAGAANVDDQLEVKTNP